MISTPTFFEGAESAIIPAITVQSYQAGNGVVADFTSKGETDIYWSGGTTGSIKNIFRLNGVTKALSGYNNWAKGEFAIWNNGHGSAFLPDGSLAIPTVLQLGADMGTPAVISQPTCNAAASGKLWYSGHTTDAKDSVAICAADATNTWGWRTIY